MNPLAVQVFRDHGVDLRREPVRIAVCAQHNNGGLSASVWWESNLKHLFPIGEACGTHGVRRPGGAALNAGQVGAIRAGRYIAHAYGDDPPPVETLGSVVNDQVVEVLECCRRITSVTPAGDQISPSEVLIDVQDRMSANAAHIREATSVASAVSAAWALQSRVTGHLRVAERRKLPLALRAADLCLTHAVYLEAIAAYLAAGGRSRGSALVLDAEGEPIGAGLDAHWRVARHGADAKVERQVLEVRYRTDGEVERRWVDIRPIPADEDWFEQVWAEYRAGAIFSPSEGG
jgi:succinate dehydrogenase/fumarate reductase flavoprotein subunit